MKRSREARAFSLIECLVSIAILGIITISLLPAIYESIRMETKTNDLNKERLYQQEIIENFKADYFNGVNPEKSGPAYRVEEERMGDMVNFTFIFISEQGSEKTIDLLLPLNTDIYKREI